MDTTEEVNDKQQSVETICEQFEGIIDCLSNFKVQMNALQQQLKALEKTVKKQLTGLQKEITKNKITSHGDIEPDFDFSLRWANRHDHNDGVVQPVVHVDSNAHVRHGSHRHGVGSDIRWCKDLGRR